ncbi:unnamed protein product, partial [marine sediment metagenome]
HMIETLLIDEIETGATAILARNHVLLKKVAQMLSDKGISNVYIGSKTELTNSEEFRRFHAFLKLIVNPYDNFSFLLIRELIGISFDEYAQIRLKASQMGKSHFETWKTDSHIEGRDDHWIELFNNL